MSACFETSSFYRYKIEPYTCGDIPNGLVFVPLRANYYCTFLHKVGRQGNCGALRSACINHEMLIAYLSAYCFIWWLANHISWQPCRRRIVFLLFGTLKLCIIGRFSNESTTGRCMNIAYVLVYYGLSLTALWLEVLNKIEWKWVSMAQTPSTKVCRDFDNNLIFLNANEML